MQHMRHQVVNLVNAGGDWAMAMGDEFVVVSAILIKRYAPVFGVSSLYLPSCCFQLSRASR